MMGPGAHTSVMMAAQSSGPIFLMIMVRVHIRRATMAVATVRQNTTQKMTSGFRSSWKPGISVGSGRGPTGTSD